MNIQALIIKIKEYIAFLKTHSFGDQGMKKRTISSLEKLIILSAISIFSLIIAIFFVITPQINAIRGLHVQKQEIMNEIYGKIGEKEGLLYLNQKMKQVLDEKEQRFKEERVLELGKYDQALLKDDSIYNVAVFLEDYAVIFNSIEKPLVINNISFGKMTDIIVLPNALKQKQEGGKSKISTPAEYRMLPLTISLEAHKDNFEQFLAFVYHSGDIKQYFFKGKPVPIMSIESLSLPVNITDEKAINTYSVKLNFYFQKAEILKAKTVNS